MTGATHTCIAVDGGGTTCRFVLLWNGARHGVTLGPANVSSDPDGAAATLREGLGALAGMARLAPEALRDVPAYLGLAGVVDAAAAAALGARLDLANARIEDDRPAAVRGALGAGDGFLAALGTGSFFARQTGGAIRLAGGWGWRLGDEASGYWIAKSALGRTLDAADGLAPETPLTRALSLRCGGGPGGIVRFANGATPADIAALAPEVLAAADGGDEAGREVAGAGAAHVARTLGALGWTPGQPVCLTGGVGPRLARFLPPGMAEALAPSAGTPLDGALALARDHAARCAA
jgi:glucosamine kinase